MATLDLRCFCGALTGEVSGVAPSAVNRVVCHCADCRAFVRHLGQSARALTKQAAVDVCQTSSGRVRFLTGQDNLACLRLSPKGLLRWYATCCNTPLAATLGTTRVPFCSLQSCGLHPQDGGTLDSATGPVAAHVNRAKDADDGLTPDELGGSTAGVILRFIKIVVTARLRGEHKRSAFFDTGTGLPLVTPQVLGLEERRALYD